MATNSKVTVEDVKKAAATIKADAEKVAAEATKTATKTAAKAKAGASKAKAEATKATKTASKTATKAVKKVKKEVVKTAVVQYQGMEFNMEDCLKKAEAGFKKDYKGKTMEEINIYVKPEEGKIYYVVNKDCVGAVEL